MTKILLSGFICLTFSFSALACKPAPLSRPECVNPDIKIDYKKYLGLLKSIQLYQKRLSSGIITPQGATSCFDNHFAVHYGMELKRFLETNKKLACKQQLRVISRTFKDLISPHTQEFRAVRNSGIQKDLQDRSVKLNAEIKEVLPGI